jgi:hypothetical protein
MKFNIKVAETWAKWFVGMVMVSIVTIGKFPLDLTAEDWKNVANTIWLALVPVVIKWVNPKDALTMTVKKK